jgi:hypothetical protein
MFFTEDEDVAAYQEAALERVTFKNKIRDLFPETSEDILDLLD